MWSFKILLFSLTLLALSSCQLFSEKQKALIKAPDNFSRLQNKEYIADKSFNAQFIDDETVVFLKNQSPDHDEIQIYIKNKDKITKQTHLKGHNFVHKPQHSEQEFLFLSDNESEKYNLTRIQERLEQKVNAQTKTIKDLYYIPILPKELLQFNFDVYKQKSNNFKQVRLTSQLTPDLWPVYLDGDIYFSRKWEDKFHIYQLNTKNKKAYRKTKTENHQTLLSAQDHLAAWVEFSDNWTDSKLKLAKSFTDKVIIELPMGVIQSIDVHPTKNLVMISSNYKDDQFELYVFDLNRSCIQRLSYLKSNEYWPSWHPSGQKFIYTSDLRSQLQVYESQFFGSNSCTEVSGNL
ncbi:MAG: hypothetical protein MK008_10635 [Bdellovibrionales bacterium]|nr:hypothetical protein [Bdellovibrionales bacterium]